MPKFTEQERKKIQNKLLAEGERLFASIGVKKVTIDDLSNAAGISHSAFYAFYESKEQLFMDINIRNQEQIYKRLRNLIAENSSRSPQDLAKLYVTQLQKDFFADSIISSIDSELLEYIARKVSPETMKYNDFIDERAVHDLSQAGVKFKYPLEYVIKSTQAIFLGISAFKTDHDRDKLASILIDALISKLVAAPL